MGLSSFVPDRWSAFHSSSRARIRAVLVFHCTLSIGCAAICSASDDDRFALLRRLGAGCGASLTFDLSLRLQGGRDLLDGGVEVGQIAHDVCRADLLAKSAQRFLPVVHRKVRLHDALQQQVRAGRELVILAREVGQRLVVAGLRVGADLAFTVRSPHEDGAVLGDPAERSRVARDGGCGCRRLRRRRARRMRHRCGRRLWPRRRGSRAGCQSGRDWGGCDRLGFHRGCLGRRRLARRGRHRLGRLGAFG